MKLSVLYLGPDQPDGGPFLNIVAVPETEATVDHIKKIEVETRCVLVISVGSIEKWKHLYGLHQALRNRWCHFEEGISDCQLADLALSSYLKNAIDHPLRTTHPIISVITTTFKSGNKLLRPLESLHAQTYQHWEWIVWDDSPEDDTETFQHLQELAAHDYRIRVYRAPKHSGFIGEMKQMAAGLARGDWVLELDHDDIIVPRLFEWISQIHNKHPNAEFIYSDCIELFEGSEEPWAYGEGFSKGYGAYASQRIRGKYHHVVQTSPINPHTLSHIVGVPNHIRVWKRTFYEAIGKHNERLPVADDYELILRTFLASPLKTRTTLYDDNSNARWVRIVYPAYYQYRNAGGNNFTFLRNALIQELVAHVYRLYKTKLETKFAEIGWTHDGLDLPSCVWELPSATIGFFPVEHFFVPEDQDDQNPCVSIITPTFQRPEKLHRAIQSVLKQSHTNWILFVVGDACDSVAKTLQEFNDDRIRFHNLATNHGAGGAVPRNYALSLLVKTKLVAYLDDDNYWEPDHLSSCIEKMQQENAPAYVFSSIQINNKPIVFKTPRFGRMDTSCVLHRTDLILKYGLWKNREEAGYAHDWEFFSRWKTEPWAATEKATLHYIPLSGDPEDHFQSIYRMYDDQTTSHEDSISHDSAEPAHIVPPAT